MKFIILMLCLCVGTQCETFHEKVYARMKEAGMLENVTTTTFSTKCFPDFGCYYNGPPWYDPEIRPVSHLPEDNPGEKIHYLLFTPENQYDPYTLQLTKESLDNSPFNESEKTAIYIHGWRSYISDTAMRLKDALVGVRRYNLFVVLWIDYNGGTYEQAAANGRVVGTAGAKLIKFLQNNTNLTPADIHLIGFSMGGQFVSYTGKQIPGLGRITAMDPAGPYFRSNNPEIRLDPGDAQFVHVIHANAGRNYPEGYGIEMPLGHQDFYPNGGEKQPSCDHDDPKLEEKIKQDPLQIFQAHNCDHDRVRLYFIESIVSQNCTFRGTECDSYDDWKKGKCPPSTHTEAVMGMDAKPIPGLPPFTKFYLDTNSKSPFCTQTGTKN